MIVQLDLETDEPIYVQLKHQIIEGIAKKQLRPGDPLPSVRSMASDIGINLHTVNKAYQQLKQEGYILIHRQKGVVIQPDGVPEADEAYKDDLFKKLRPFIADAVCRQIDEDEFIKCCSNIFAEFNQEEGEL
ncbi:GntR family transcriptional regulator [Oceanobacillus piezotolerans]|uniref:GntR family transcriptional regulator n=1 Tax=Oceanobacillus piezotolerans TaxID=2448030 RepID=A0A498D635_9BACI|nr:GntR family transcriptional regulator [Oceanobacillus piezotolerans]RLL40349.1 GntR family transcriptional regulator [Oceanobacillus piezotolerans]